jgi:hypothetical protein
MRINGRVTMLFWVVWGVVLVVSYTAVFFGFDWLRKNKVLRRLRGW